MNDVVICYSTTITKNKDNQVVKIEETFSPVNVRGTFPTAFDYQLEALATKIKNISIINDSSTVKVTNNMELDQEKDWHLYPKENNE